MRRTEMPWAMIAVLAIAIGGCSKTEAPKPSTDGGTAAVGTGGAGANLSDPEFVKDAAMKNIAEVELSRMALTKAASTDVKTFAQMMIDDHGAAADKLKSLASGASMEWPAQLDEKHRKAADELAGKQGFEFEREYAKAMVEGHQDFTAKLESRLDVQSLADWKTAAAGRAQSKALPDPNAAMRDVAVRPAASTDQTTIKINQWAAETYPVAQKHLDAARTLEDAAKKRSTD